MAKYQWKSPTTKLLCILRASLAAKRKAGWSRDSGAGFIAEDIVWITLVGRTRTSNYMVKVALGGSFHGLYVFSMPDLNLRETEELIRFLEGKREG